MNPLQMASAALTFTIAAASSGQVLNESVTLQADDAASGDEFGHSVAFAPGASGVVISAHEAGSTRGAAYLIRSSGQVLLEPPALAVGDSFGECVAIGSGYVVVGAPGDDDAGANAGIAYVFDAATGDYLRDLVATDATALAQLGTSAAIEQGFVVVGAPRTSIDGVERGAVYLFDLSTGDEVRKITAPSGANFDNFGIDVAVVDEIVVVGASGASGAGGNSGLVYLFEASTGALLDTVDAPDASVADNFGYAVAVDGDLIAIGAWADDDGASGAGSAYVYRISTGEFVNKLLPDDPEEMGRFGWDVAIAGERVLVGAKWNDIDPPPGVDPREGEAYVFDALTGQEIGRLQQAGGGSGNWFGTSVAMTADRALVGAPGRSQQEGRAFIFQLPTPQPCPADTTGDGQVDLADLNAVLANFGQASDVGDTNGDGNVDLADLNAVLASFGTPCE